MSEAAERISLTSALTLAAFGVEVSGEQFAKVMNAEHFGLTRADAFSKFAGALDALLNRAASGDLVLNGRFACKTEADGTEAIEAIPAASLLSFAAFDYRVDGLRFGALALLWFRTSEDLYPQPSFARPDHYRDITVVRGQVRKFLGTGSSPYRQETQRPRLPEADLMAWWGELSTEQKNMSRDALWKMANDSHPKYKITRQRIRELGGQRTPGRPKSAKKKPAD